MFLLSCALVMIIFLLMWNCKRPKNFPPGPPFWPIIGNVSVLKKLKTLKFHHLLWDNLSRTYGSLIGLKFFNDYVVIVSGNKWIKELYNRVELNGRPNGFFFRVRSFDKRLGVVFTDGDLWEDQRRFSVKAMKSFGFGKTTMYESIEFEAKELIKSIEKQLTCDGLSAIQKANNNIFDISVMNVMWTILRGKRYELDDEIIITLMESIHKCFQIIDMSGGILNHLPFIRHIFPRKSGYQPLIDSMKPLWNFLRINIDEVMKNFTDEISPNNFIEQYCVEIIKNNKNESFFTKEQLLALCIDFFQAGSETTSNTLAFAVLYMLHHPKIMQKVQNEIKSVAGNRLPKWIDYQNLNYTKATIYEIQRMSNVAPLGIAHRVTEDMKVQNFTIPKNSLVLFNIFSIHMDENCWKSPKDFNPDRFINDKNELIFNENFIPFGLGKRRCIGETLAKSSLFIFFTSFLHSFDISYEGTLPGLEGRDGITLSPHPFKVKLKRRSEVVVD